MTLSATRRLVSIQKRRFFPELILEEGRFGVEGESLLEAKLRSQGPDGFGVAAILKSSLEGLK